MNKDFEKRIKTWATNPFDESMNKTPQPISKRLEEILNEYADAVYWGSEGWTKEHAKDSVEALPKALEAINQELRRICEEVIGEDEKSGDAYYIIRNPLRAEQRKTLSKLIGEE